METSWFQGEAVPLSGSGRLDICHHPREARPAGDSRLGTDAATGPETAARRQGRRRCRPGRARVAGWVTERKKEATRVGACVCTHERRARAATAEAGKMGLVQRARAPSVPPPNSTAPEDAPTESSGAQGKDGRLSRVRITTMAPAAASADSVSGQPRGMRGRAGRGPPRPAKESLISSRPHRRRHRASIPVPRCTWPKPSPLRRLQDPTRL
jgi:hypothetical protein